MLSFEGKLIDFGANKPKLRRFEIRAFCDKMRPFCTISVSTFWKTHPDMYIRMYMSLCVYACVCVCMYVYMYVYMYDVCMYIYIYIRYRSSGKLFNIRRFAAKAKVLLALARNLLYIDDCDLVAHTESDMQCFMDRLSEACRAFGLTISLDKTVVMFQPAPGTVYVDPSIYTDGKKLKVVDKFTYLGSTINRFCSLDDEIAICLKKATGAFSALKHRVWSHTGLKKTSKLEVYNACVLTCLKHSC